MSERHPVLLVGIDAADIGRVETMCQAGELPVLDSLRRRGRSGSVASTPRGFLSMVWANFYNGQTVPYHGWYFNKMWNPSRMRLEYATSEWLPQRPFWDSLDPERFRVALLDVPYSPQPSARLNGLYVSGWQMHDDFGQISIPESAREELEREFGRSTWPPELFGAQSPRTLLRLRDQLLASTEQFAAVGEALLRRERWDLFLAVLGAAHRGGHYLWDLSQIDLRGLSPDVRRTLEGALAEVYRACDRALGRLLEAAPPDSRVIVFALHGMEANPGWSERFPEIVARIHTAISGEVPRRGWLYRLKRALPWKLARRVTTRLPSAVAHRLVPLWSARMWDWSSTRFFALPVDVNGFLRVNLRGREAEGIVDQGEEYEDLCREIGAAFHDFRIIETGEPIVEAVDFLDDLAPPGAPRRGLLPDLVVNWRSSVSSRGISGIRSRTYGEVRWDPRATFPSGRAGNHHGRGWFVAAGPGILPGREGSPRDVLDLTPTVLKWLGAGLPAELQGTPIPALSGEEEGTGPT